MFLNTASVPRECKMKSFTLTLKLHFQFVFCTERLVESNKNVR